MFMKGMNPEWGKEIKERIGTDYKGYVVVCAHKTSEPHWPDELCSLQRGDFSGMRGSKPGD